MKIALLALLGLVFAALLAVALWAYTPDKPRREIEAKYHVGPNDYREVDGVRLHLRDEGRRNAPAVILLHGFGSSLETWDAWVETLKKDFRVIRFDWPGFGLSGRDPADDYTDARSLVVLQGVMSTLGITRASLVGNSIGGKLAWMFAAKRPESVEKLVLISPDGFASDGFEYGKAPDIPWTVRLLPYVLPKALVRQSLEPAFGDKTRLTDTLVTRYRDLLLAPGTRDAMLIRMHQVRLDPPEPLLNKIKAPTLLLWGEKDGMIPVSNAQDFLRAIPGARLVALPGVGHVPQEEAAVEALGPVRGFLMGR